MHTLFSSLHTLARRLPAFAPGLALCLGVTVLALGLEVTEAHLVGRAWLEALVLAILLGTAVRTAWAPGDRFTPGIDLSAKLLLECAIVLLGLSVSAKTVLNAGPALLGGIAAVVFIAIAISYAIGRGFGLSHKLAMLIACGNSICGNSAIVATAPVIRAESNDVAASIAFTAVLGVIVVLALPLADGLLGFTRTQYGVFAGLTVYAVPQVIAATAPIGALSVQVGTLVKLVRVLMLGPVILVLSLASREPDADVRHDFRLHHLVPWFILGFLAMIALRSTGYVPHGFLAPAAAIANGLTIVAMAALGLSVDIRTVTTAGARVTSVVVLSLAGLGLVSLALVKLLHLA